MCLVQWRGHGARLTCAGGSHDGQHLLAAHAAAHALQQQARRWVALAAAGRGVGVGALHAKPEVAPLQQHHARLARAALRS